MLQQIEVDRVAGDLGQHPLQLLALQYGTLFIEIDPATNVQAELGTLLEGLGQFGQLRLLGGGQLGAAGQEGKLVQIFRAPRQGSQQGEGGGNGLAQGVAEHVPEDVAEAEVGLIQIPFDFQVHLNDVVGVAQQGDGQPQRQILGLLAFHLFTQLELLDGDVVVTFQLAALQLVVELHGELTLVDGVTGIGGGVGAEGGEFQIGEGDGHIQHRVLDEQVGAPRMVTGA